MREIDLGDGRVALVDDDDFEELDKFNWWVRRGSVVRTARGLVAKPTEGCDWAGLIRMHHVIMKVRGGVKIIHKNRDQLDCRKENLSFSKRELLRRDREARGAKRRRRNRAVYIP